MFATYAEKFGTVEFEGKTFALKQDAYLTDRVFHNSWSDAKEGEEYTTEFGAAAIDEDGNDYFVIWHFTDIKGEELDDWGSYPWSLGPDSVDPR